ncbi:MAG: peptidylprolyl isomerase [Gemmatimonadales bacterium]
MRRWLPAVTLAASLLGGAASGLSAQVGEPIDRIVAVVGTTPILFSMVEERFYQNQANPAARIPKDSVGVASYKRLLVDTLINEELLYQEAIKDTTIQVTDQEVAEAVDGQLARQRRQYKTQQEFDTEMRGIGFNTLDDYRKWMLEQQRKEFYRERFSQLLRQKGTLKDLMPTEKEVRNYYDAFAAAGMLGMRPAAVSLRQIIVSPKPTPEADAKALALVDSIIGELRKGADFATAAKRFGMDGTRDLGGDLGFFRRGAMVREFEEVAFQLKPGVISNAVKSPFGYHVIQVTRAQPTEVQARHILIIPEVDSTGALAAKVKIDNIAAQLAAGASFDSLQRIYHDQSEERDISGIFVDSLPPAYMTALAGVDSGKVTKPFSLEVANQPLRTKWGIAKVTQRIPEGPVSYDAVRENIRLRLGRELGLGAYMGELRRRTFVDIRWP